MGALPDAGLVFGIMTYVMWLIFCVYSHNCGSLALMCLQSAHQDSIFGLGQITAKHWQEGWLGCQNPG